jgi:hypothetical protein
MKYKLLFVVMMFLLLVVNVSASDINFTNRKGETWVVWNWSIPSEYINSGCYVTVRVDGIIANNISLDTNLTIPYNYYLTGVNPNEEHNVNLEIYNSSGLLIDGSSTVTTRHSDLLYYVLFIVAMQLLLLSVFKRNKLVSVVFSSFSLLVMLFISYVFVGYNDSFSNIGLICAVLSGFIVIYNLYEVYKSSSGWEGGW